MNKTLKKLFITISLTTLGTLFILTLIFRIPSKDYLVLLTSGIILSFILSFIIEKIFFTPIQQMQKVTKQIASGNFHNRLSLSRQDELGDLANNLNQVSVELQNRIMEIMQDKHELQVILSSMVEGVIVIARNDKILLLSNPILDMLDLRSKETIGKPYWEVIRNQEINFLLEESIKNKKSIKKEITIFSSEESHFSMQISTVLLESGDLSCVIAVFHDITELKKFARMRSEFVANVSHELKTPLTTIKGFVETLREGALEDKEKAKKFLDIIEKHTQRLEYLVNDLLTLSAIESKEIKLNFEKIDIRPMIESAVSLCKEQLEKNQHKISVHIAKDLPPVLVDRAKMEQVFLNLLDNAVKFTAPGGLITVEAARQNGSIKIDFKDTGIGIETEHLPRLFERFYRVDKGRSRDLGGTGLGLSIVKHILQIHNGQISVQSQPNKGSTFSVFLPIT